MLTEQRGLTMQNNNNKRVSNKVCSFLCSFISDRFFKTKQKRVNEQTIFRNQIAEETFRPIGQTEIN